MKRNRKVAEEKKESRASQHPGRPPIIQESKSLWKREQSFWGIIHFRMMSKENSPFARQFRVAVSKRWVGVVGYRKRLDNSRNLQRI